MSTYTDPTVVSVGTGSKLQPGPLFALIASAIIVLTGVLFIVQTAQAKSEKEQVETEIQSNTKKKEALNPVALQLNQLADQNRNLKTLFDNQKRWEIVLGKIEQRLYRNMAVTSFLLNADGTFSLTGVTPTYTDYAKIYSSLTDAEAAKTFATAKPVSVTKQEANEETPEQVVFTFALTLQQSVLNAR